MRERSNCKLFIFFFVQLFHDIQSCERNARYQEYMFQFFTREAKWRLGKERKLVSFGGSNATLVPIP